jgi:antitoxin ParD1/3/4
MKGVIMAKTTSVSLGDHFTGFIEAQVESGRFGSASEVVRAGLRSLEEHETKHQALQRAITEGLNSGVAEGFSMDALQQEMDNE